MATIPTLFCNSLRRRPSFASAIPKLQQQSQFVVQGTHAHDSRTIALAQIMPQNGSSLHTTLPSPSRPRSIHSVAQRLRLATYAFCSCRLLELPTTSSRPQPSESDISLCSLLSRLPSSSCSIRRATLHSIAQSISKRSQTTRPLKEHAVSSRTPSCKQR